MVNLWYTYHEEGWCMCPGCGLFPYRSEISCAEPQTGEDRLCNPCREALKEKGYYEAYCDLIVAHRGNLINTGLAWPPTTCYNGGQDAR